MKIWHVVTTCKNTQIYWDSRGWEVEICRCNIRKDSQLVSRFQREFFGSASHPVCDVFTSFSHGRLFVFITLEKSFSGFWNLSTQEMFSFLNIMEVTPKLSQQLLQRAAHLWWAATRILKQGKVWSNKTVQDLSLKVSKCTFLENASDRSAHVDDRVGGVVGVDHTVVWQIWIAASKNTSACC